MNGRVYYPQLARFLSPDPQLQAPGNALNYNRYTYCMNNPMMYTDPSGEIILTIAAAIFCPPLLPVAIAADISGMMNAYQHKDQISDGFSQGVGNGIWKSFAYYGVGAGEAAATYYGGPVGGLAASYISPALNGLIDDGQISSDEYNLGQITTNAIVGMGVSSLGVGDFMGDKASSIFSNTLAKELTSNIISSNVDGLLHSGLQGMWTEGNLNGFSDYFSKGGYIGATASGVSGAILNTYDPKTIEINKYKDRAKNYLKENNTLTGMRAEMRYANRFDIWQAKQSVLYRSKMRNAFSMEKLYPNLIPSPSPYRYTTPVTPNYTPRNIQLQLNLDIN